MAYEDVYAEVASASAMVGVVDEVSEQYATVLDQLLPPGRLWRWDAGTNARNLLRALGYVFDRIELRGIDLLKEFDPATMQELVPDWERVLGLPGDNPSPPTTLAGRRAAISAKLLGNEDPTPQFFIDLAAAVGYTVLIVHKVWSPFIAGSAAGDALFNNNETDSGWAWYWEVVTQSGDNDALLEWLITSLVPLHTQVSFVYVDLVTWGDLSSAAPKDVRLRGVGSDGGTTLVAVGNADGSDGYLLRSGNGTQWVEKSNPKNVRLEKVVYGGGTWVAVGWNDGSDAYILTSSDADAWTERSNPKNGALYAVTYGGGTFVAVGAANGSDADAYLLTSANAGVSWTERSNPKNRALYAVTYGGGTFVAVGAADTDAYLLTSANAGVSWTERSNPKNRALYAVGYYDGRFVAVGGDDGGDTYLLTSDDAGLSWTERATPATGIINQVLYVETFGLWLAVGSAAGAAFALTSPDGTTWTEVTGLTLGFLSDASWHPDPYNPFGRIYTVGQGLLGGIDIWRTTY